MFRESSLRGLQAILSFVTVFFFSVLFNFFLDREPWHFRKLVFLRGVIVKFIVQGRLLPLFSSDQVTIA